MLSAPFKKTDAQKLTTDYIITSYIIALYLSRRFVAYIYAVLFGSFAVRHDEHVCNYKRARRPYFFKYSISIVTRQCYFRPDVLFVRLQPYRSTDLTEPDRRLRKHEQFFFPPPDGSMGRGEADWRTPRRGMRAERRIELRRLTGIDSRARSHESAARSGGPIVPRPATLGNPFDRAIDIQADGCYVRNAFVIPNRDSASKSSSSAPSRRRSATRGMMYLAGGGCRGVHYFSREPRDFNGAKWGFITNSWTSAFSSRKGVLKNSRLAMQIGACKEDCG